MSVKIKRGVAWKSLLINGTEYCALWQTDDGWLLKGAAVGVLKDQRPMLANYEIDCDDNWLTHRVQVERTIGSDVKTARPQRGEPWGMAQFGARVARGTWLSGC